MMSRAELYDWIHTTFIAELADHFAGEVGQAGDWDKRWLVDRDRASCLVGECIRSLFIDDSSPSITCHPGVEAEDWRVVGEALGGADESKRE